MRNRVRVGLILLCTLLGCASPEPGPGGFERDAGYAVVADPRSDAEELEALDRHEEWLRRDLDGADLVFVGRVEAVGKAPGFWSGLLAVRQPVRYRVVRTLKGLAPAEVLDVHHLIVGPPTTEEQGPELRRNIWHEGAELLVWASLVPLDGQNYKLDGGSESPGPLRAAGPAAARAVEFLR